MKLACSCPFDKDRRRWALSDRTQLLYSFATCRYGTRVMRFSTVIREEGIWICVCTRSHRMFSLQLVFGVPDYVTITHARDHAREPHYRTHTQTHTDKQTRTHKLYQHKSHIITCTHNILYIINIYKYIYWSFPALKGYAITSLKTYLYIFFLACFDPCTYSLAFTCHSEGVERISYSWQFQMTSPPRV